MPMHRWMHSAAGGTNHRLKPAVAMILSRSRMPKPAEPAGNARSNVVVIDFPPKIALLWRVMRSKCPSAPTESIARFISPDRKIKYCHSQGLYPTVRGGAGAPVASIGERRRQPPGLDNQRCGQGFHRFAGRHNQADGVARFRLHD